MESLYQSDVYIRIALFLAVHTTVSSWCGPIIAGTMLLYTADVSDNNSLKCVHAQLLSAVK